MRATLTAHPDFPSDAVFGIEAGVERDGATLALRFELTGAVAKLALPPDAAADRADELWRHTCFEAFLRPQGGSAYVELNFAPSTQWAAYRFSGYREGMTPADIAPPRMALTGSEASLELAVRLDLARLGLPPGPCRLGLSAVIEEAGGAKSYWALAHPPGKPDFHHIAGYAYDLPEEESP